MHDFSFNCCGSEIAKEIILTKAICSSIDFVDMFVPSEFAVHSHAKVYAVSVGQTWFSIHGILMTDFVA